MWVYTYKCCAHRGQKKVLETPGARVTGNCGPPDVGARK